MSWTLLTSAAVIMKAGANASSTATASGSLLKEYADHAEAYINAATEKDWVSAYSTTGANFQKVLGDVASSKAAMYVIAYDMSGYTSRTEAQTMLDIYSDNVERGIQILKNRENQMR